MGPRSPGTPTRPAPRARPMPTRPLAPRQGPAGPAVSAPPEPVEPAARDIRRKRPPALSFLLRISTARRIARVLTLLALDFAGVALAIFTALVLKEALRGHVTPSVAIHGTRQFLAFAYLLTALLFARSGL